MNDPTMPIQHDFRDEVKAIAAAGYRAYHSGRVFRPWGQLPDNERFRWCLAADTYWREEIEDPADLRSIYQRCIHDVAWDDLAPKSRERWQAVRRAMLVERSLQRGTAKVVISG